MLVVFHKDNGIDFNFKWLSYNKATDIFKYDPITQNNWVRSDTKVFKFSEADFFKFKEIDVNINKLIFFSDSLLGTIGLKKITTNANTYTVNVLPTDLDAINYYTQAEIDIFLADNILVSDFLAANPSTLFSSQNTITLSSPYNSTVNFKTKAITTQEVTQIVTSIQGTLVDLNTEMQVAP